MQDIDGGLPEMYGPNKSWDKHRDYYVKETARISWHYYSIIVPGFSKLDRYNTFKFLSSSKTFPSAFFSPQLFLQTFGENVFKVKGMSVLQGINKSLLSPCCWWGTNSCLLGAYNVIVKKYSSHLKVFRIFYSCTMQFTCNV